MSAAEFAAMAFEQVERFGLLEDTPETYKDLFSRLTAVRETVHVSDGSQWLPLANSALAGRHRSTIRYALISIDSIGGTLAKLEEATEPSTDQRKQVNTHLTRGKKWARLVDELGFGILLMRAWDLGKSPELTLETLLDLGTGYIFACESVSNENPTVGGTTCESH
ncbi:uncharacterized protein DNG_09861 [Cephalotrichum gorgonifer]|uniref:Uncharacterized protein n=1 Tax=Cephalotrichum gorgonifer TaxID=2041049 RepID=A0AAE8N8R2_9PEZI|nr:uncharacterized protein DNG_09861 [Cephalotrichum gorgonifer]